MRLLRLLFPVFLQSAVLPGCIIGSGNVVQVPVESDRNDQCPASAPPADERRRSSGLMQLAVTTRPVIGSSLVSLLVAALVLMGHRAYDKRTQGSPSRQDVLVDAARSTAAGDPERARHAFDLFVVYAASDASDAGFVHRFLLPALDLHPSRVLLIDALSPGAPIVSEIERAVSCSRFTLVVLSAAYLEDRWAVFGEQLASHLSVPSTRIIPLRLTDCELPLHLEARVALDFTDRDGWTAEVVRMRSLLGSRRA